MVVLTGGGSALFTLTVKGTDIMTPTSGKGGVPLESIRLVNNGVNGVSTMEFLHEDPTKAFSLPAGSEVIFTDTRTPANGPLFGGFLVSRELVPAFGQVGRAVRCMCVDYSSLLDRYVVPVYLQTGATAGGDSDATCLVSALSYIGIPLTVRLAPSGGTGFRHTATVSPQTYQGIPARSMIEQTAEYAAGVNDQYPGGPRVYFVDSLKVINYNVDGQVLWDPPYDISDSPGAEQIAAEDLQLEYDETSIVNAVYTRGSAKAYSGWYRDSTSIATYGERQGIIDRPQALTLTQATRFGKGYVADHKDPVVRGSFLIKSAGSGTGSCYASTGPPDTATITPRHWQPSQRFRITNAALGLTTSTYWYVRTVETSFTGGSGHHSHRITFGGLSPRGTARVARALAAAGVTTLGTAATATAGQRIQGTIG